MIAGEEVVVVVVEEHCRIVLQGLGSVRELAVACAAVAFAAVGSEDFEP